MGGVLVEAVRDYLGGLGFPFALGFLGLLAAFVYFQVRWSLERDELRIDPDDLRSVIAEVEAPAGWIHSLIGERVNGSGTEGALGSVDTGAFRLSLEGRGLLRSSEGGELFVQYLHGVLSTPKKRLLSSDNRLRLTRSRNTLRRHQYHRVINIVLASASVSLGILGTVGGLWLAFRYADFSDVQRLGDSLGGVMRALSRALYTTGTGLALSIPMIAVGLRMEGELERIFDQLEELRDAVVSTIRCLETEREWGLGNSERGGVFQLSSKTEHNGRG